MEINTEFALPLEPAAAYEFLLDLEQVAPCMPGATLGGEREDGAREVTVAVKLGPMRFNYAGTVRIAERDESARRAVLVGEAREKRGQGSARATVTMTVAEGGSGGSQVASKAEFELTGRAAQTGRGIVEDVAKRMVADMSACLTAKTSATTATPAATTAAATPGSAPQADPAPRQSEAPAAGPPVRGGRLFLSILWERLRRLFSRRA